MKYSNFEAFYQDYLKEHAHPLNRKMHYIGTSGALIFILLGLLTSHSKFFILALIFGYGFAWLGHFFVEKNKPMTFKYPLYSLRADFQMLFDFLAQKLS
jgi:hypothetical protein